MIPNKLKLNIRSEPLDLSDICSILINATSEDNQKGSGKQPPRVQKVFPGQERENG
jgi:hypothetical protein